MPHHHDPYKSIHALYDLEHGSFDDDVELFLSVAAELEGRILELACGSGRLLRPLAASGYDVTGIDTSAAMLARAREILDPASDSIPGTVQLAEIDMRQANHAPGGPFALAIYSLNGFLHLTSQQDQLASLRAVHAALDEGGTVVLDLMNPSPDYLERIAGATVYEGAWTMADGTDVQKWAHRQLDSHAQTIETDIWYDLTDRAGHLRRVRTGFTLRYVHLAELSLILQLAGFHHLSTYGTYQLDPLLPNSERLIVIAERTP